MRRLVVGTTLLMLACGTTKAWEVKGAPKAIPDEQYRTGVEAGQDVWVWHCVANERVVITQFSSAFCGAQAPRLERGPCGGPLPVEMGLGSRRSGPIPEGYRWPGSPPPPPEPEESVDASDASRDASVD
jgi:hypothetical protein